MLEATSSFSTSVAEAQKSSSEGQPLPRFKEAEIVEITPAAIAQFKETLKGHPPESGIRLGVVGGGCAGLQYDMLPCNEILDGDFVQTTEGIRFFIHPVAAAYLKGTRIDYSTALMEGGFKFINPNATSSCGCGTSFGV